MIGLLPEHLTVGDTDYKIRSDYRDVLYVFEVFADPELEQGEKWIVAIYLLFEAFTCADDVFEAAENGFDVNETAKQIIWFISAGQEKEDRKELPTYDWAQDEQMIFSAVNKVAGIETRQVKYIHWWTFLGYFNEVGEGAFSFVVGIRNKLNKGNKLEKHEREFVNNNRELFNLKKPQTKEEQEAEEDYQSLLDEVIG